MSKKHMLAAIAALALISLVPSAQATDITYTVDLTIGTGSVVGTIVTNGTIGDLTPGDVVGGTLDITGAGYSKTKNLPSAFYYFYGDEASATSSDLLFNFSGTDQGGIEIGQANADFFWNIGSAGFPYGGGDYPGMNISYGATATYTPTLSGEYVIGAVATPEPGTLSMLALGMLGFCAFIGINRRRPTRLAPTA